MATSGADLPHVAHMPMPPRDYRRAQGLKVDDWARGLWGVECGVMTDNEYKVLRDLDFLLWVGELFAELRRASEAATD